MDIYTKLYNPASGNFDLFDPEGQKIAEVMEADADSLLKHLNRC